MDSQSRFLTLDAMRGLAALMVVLLHFSKSIVPSGGVAVDFFFALSGFVIARVYDSRLLTGLSVKEFIGIRVVRLYPLYILGLLLGCMRFLMLVFSSTLEEMDLKDIFISVFWGIIFLPSFVNEQLNNLNPPSWSLYFELLANFIYALIVFRLNKKSLFVVALLFAVALVYFGLDKGSLDLGVRWSEVLAGIARVGFSFVVGVLISRAHTGKAQASWLSMFPMLLLVSAMFIRASDSMRIFVDVFLVICISPLVLWLGASYSVPPIFSKLAAALGLVSYPIYAIHYPLLRMAGDYAKINHISGAYWLPIFVIVLVSLGWILGKDFDPFVRSILSGVLFRKQRPLQIGST